MSTEEAKNGHCKERTEVRSEVLELNARRTQIENEIKEYNAILQTQGVGMNDSLVDSEGFPRNDIDINQVRLARNRIICLQNDIRGIMKQIEEKLGEYFDKPE
ncbi:26S proteasome non-ATPase regulatory subunit 9 [Tyrophagus putrescentiae]|nr:26S proteasome non-ATPase regulatory subunit 9 [Tyrophagus putrescentiae]